MPSKLMHDRYRNFEMLERAEPPDAFNINCHRRLSKVAIIAPHGGKIERWTSEIARAIAADDYSLYCFEGQKNSNNRDLHITSSNFNEPVALALVSDCDQVIAVHGCTGNQQVIYLGGLDAALKHAVCAHLEAVDYTVDVHKNPKLQGLDPSNICNRSRRGCGVQLEISYGLRTALMVPTHPHIASRLDTFAEAVREAINARQIV